MSKLEVLKTQKRMVEFSLADFSRLAKEAGQKVLDLDAEIAELEKQDEPFPLQKGEWVVLGRSKLHRALAECPCNDDLQCQRPAPLWIPIPDDMMEAPNIKGLIAVKTNGRGITSFLGYVDAWTWDIPVGDEGRITHIMILEDQE